jgi:hypothetical protein
LAFIARKHAPLVATLETFSRSDIVAICLGGADELIESVDELLPRPNALSSVFSYLLSSVMLTSGIPGCSNPSICE